MEGQPPERKPGECALPVTRGRDVLWCHPAFDNRQACIHNGQELSSPSRQKSGTGV